MVSSPHAVELAEIRPGVSHPDRKKEDSVSSWRHLPGTELSGRPFFLSFFFFLFSFSHRAVQAQLLALEQSEVVVGMERGVLLAFTCLPYFCSYSPSHLHFVTCILLATWISSFTLACWFKGFEKTGDFSNFPGCSAMSHLVSLEESPQGDFPFLITRAPFQGCLENSSGVSQNSIGRHTPSPLEASVFLCLKWVHWTR